MKQRMRSQDSGLASRFIVLAVCASVAVVCCPAHAQSQMTPGAPSVPLTTQALANGVQNRITYQYGIEFVTIGAPGNPNWTAPPNASDNMRNNGGLDYEYRLGRTEVTTAQYVSFINAALARPSSDYIPYISAPSVWGAELDPTYQGPGQRFRVVPGRENWGVGGISWRAAAVYCNWLTNDQQSSRVSFLSGAYNVSTFGAVGNTLTDQTTHTPGARFWIPSMGEWMKAAYYDPNSRATSNVPGWFRYPNGTDRVPIYRAPEDGGEANAGFNRSSTGRDATEIPLMSYPTVQSPWGLLDMAGGAEEWTESVYTSPSGYMARFELGSAWAVSADMFSDRLGFAGSGLPIFEGYFSGLRVAASVPAPGAGVAFFVMVGGALRRRRR